MKFKDFQAPALFSSTFKAVNLGEKNSSTFKDAGNPAYNNNFSMQHISTGQISALWYNTAQTTHLKYGYNNVWGVS